MKERMKYYVLTFIRYLGDAFFYPFFALYLHTKDNVGEAKIGILIALTPLIGLIANPIFSKICKNFKTLKSILGIIGILEAIMICVLVNTSNFYMLLIFTILLSLVGSSHYGLFDSLLTIYATESKINFSNIRVWGSISYIFGTAIAGVFIEKFNYAISFYVCAFFFIVASILYFLVKPIYNEIKKEGKRSYKEVLFNGPFILYAIFYMLMYGVLKTSNNYYPLLLESRNLSESIFGYNYTIFVGVEAAMLILLDKINKRVNYKNLMLIAILSITVMSFINASSFPSIVLIIMSALRGIAWSIILHVSNKIVVNMLGVKNTTLGTMLLDLSYSIIVIICNSSGGFIIEKVGYQWFYFLLAIIATIDTVFYLVFVRKYICINDEIDNGNIGVVE